MRQRSFDIGAVYLHLALVSAVVGGALLLVRLIVPSLTAFTIALGLYVLGRRTPPPVDTGVDTSAGPGADGTTGPQDEIHPHPPARPEPVQATEAPEKPAPQTLSPPSGPSGRPLPPWAPPARRIRIRSAAEDGAALQRARRRAPDIRVTLVSDVASPHHPYAVGAFVGPDRVGDLAGDDVLDYGPALADLRRSGIDLTAAGYMTSHALDVDVPEPTGLVPANAVPHGAILPHGARFVVEPLPVDADAATAAGDDARSRADAILTPYAGRWIAAVLEAVRPGRQREPVSAVEVSVDGVRVGRVTGRDATDLAPLLAYCGDRHVAAVAAAVVEGAPARPRLVVSCIRARDADDDWLRGLGR